MQKLSCILVERNEEANIGACLKTVSWADEIVIVDQSSTDKTVEIAHKFTDKVFVTSHKGFAEPDIPFAVSRASYDWILYIEPDQRITAELKAEILSILYNDPPYTSYYIPTKNLLLGKWIRGSGWYPCYVLRLFRKGRVLFSNTMHELMRPVSRSGYLKSPLIHYTYMSIEQYVTKLNRFSTVIARQSDERGKRAIFFNFILYCFIKPPAYFIKKFILQRGFIDGFEGFLIAFFTFLLPTIVYTKLWLMQKTNKNS